MANTDDIPAFATGSTASELHRRIVEAGLESGLCLDAWREHKKPRHAHRCDGEASLLVAPVVFTLRPVEEYARHYRGCSA